MHSKKLKAVNIVEEVFNSITHGLGFAAGITGLVLGTIFIATRTSVKVGFIIYCSTLIIVMLASTLYHSLIFTKANKVFRAIDHSSIFLLIAGSFTPFVIYLYGGWSQLMMLLLTWSLAVLGIVITNIFVLPRDMKITGVLLYLVFGWLGLLLIPKMGLLDNFAVWMVLIGGLVYTIGVIPFAIKKPFAHFSWHIFVVAAAVLHFLAISSL
jgi:hemolysin III